MVMKDVYTYSICFKSGERIINKVVVFPEYYSNIEIKDIIKTKFKRVSSVESINKYEKALYVEVGSKKDVNYPMLE